MIVDLLEAIVSEAAAEASARSRKVAPRKPSAMSFIGGAGIGDDALRRVLEERGMLLTSVVCDALDTTIRIRAICNRCGAQCVTRVQEAAPSASAITALLDAVNSVGCYCVPAPWESLADYLDVLIGAPL